MDTNPLKNFYKILGVPNNATPEQIKAAYWKLMKENHPDRFTGKRKQYEKSGDDELLKIIDEKIAQANEKTQQIIEAYETLSNPSKRSAYDSSLKNNGDINKAPPPKIKPEIILSTSTIIFGELTKGINKKKFFTINNKGGMPTGIHIDWDGRHECFGELDIQPDPINTFPIKVIVEVKTEKAYIGFNTGKIIIDVDGVEYEVNVSVTVVMPAPTPEPTPITPSRPISTPVSIPLPPPPRPSPTPTPAPTFVYNEPPNYNNSLKTNVQILLFVLTILAIITVIGLTHKNDPVITPARINLLVTDWHLIYDKENPGEGQFEANINIENTGGKSANISLSTRGVVKTINSQLGRCVYSDCSNELLGVDLNDKLGYSVYIIEPNSTVTVKMTGTYYTNWYDEDLHSITQLCVDVVNNQSESDNDLTFAEWKLYPEVSCYSW